MEDGLVLSRAELQRLANREKVSDLPGLDEVLKELTSQLSNLIKPEFFRKMKPLP